MNKILKVIPFVFLFVACESVPDQVKNNKNKFIQVAKENAIIVSNDGNINGLTQQIYEATKSNNVEAKMKYLHVDNIETFYATKATNEINIDSIVLFKKGSYQIFYDFAVNERKADAVKRNCTLSEFEQIDDRLYIGRK